MMHLLVFAVVTGLALVVTLLVGRDAWFNADANLRLAEIDDGRSRSGQGDRAAARRDVQVRRAELRLFAAARAYAAEKLDRASRAALLEMPGASEALEVPGVDLLLAELGAAALRYAAAAPSTRGGARTQTRWKDLS